MPEETQTPLILISGASQGIGAAIAECFANADFPVRLALIARNEIELEKVKARCGGATDVQSYVVDVSDEQQVQDFSATLDSELGDVSVLINNAGAWHGAAIQDMSVADFDRIIAVNLRSTFLLSRMVLPSMLRRQFGDIFNMSSTAGFEGYAGVSAYCAAKHGVNGFTKALREEVRGKGIRVSCVSPGPTYSPSWRASGVAKEQLMPAEDVARAFVDIYRMDRNVVIEDIVLRPQCGHITS
ncbi:SDR family oxidoreductase [Zhongshania sp. BJYM1]|uniref:SDR family oxidoreductase n=1 Tax=Zhongshania aquatica TaxID=2965069 RepID=UPI0022B437BF|nr:SDR family oxidoreductase [Marortus sp. BJYM1]